MLKNVFIASNNKHKINEIKEIFKINNLNIEILCPNDFNYDDEPIEDGLTFEENAIIKAKYYYDLCKIPTIGEDAGLCIDYFGGRPGIYSKRFLCNFNDKQKNEYIIEMMKYVYNRKATFYDYVAYIDKDSKITTFEGKHVGEISKEIKGDEGFGYDPIFYLPEFKKTEAELGNDYKNNNSHRALAFKKWIDYVNEK